METEWIGDGIGSQCASTEGEMVANGRDGSQLCSTLGALPWTYLLRWFAVCELAPMRLTSRLLQATVDGSVEAITVTGPDSASSILTHHLHTRLPHLRCVWYRLGGPQASGVEGQALLELLAALAPRCLQLRVITAAAVTASTRQVQRYSLAPDLLASISRLAPWTVMEVPCNPSALPTPGHASMAAAAVTGAPAAGAVGVGPTDAGLAAAAAAAGGAAGSGSAGSAAAADGAADGGAAAADRAPAAPAPAAAAAQVSTALAQQLPLGLQRLRLDLSRQLSDVSCLTGMSSTLVHLHITSFTGSTAVHAAALAQLTQLTSLSLTWPSLQCSGPPLGPPCQQTVAAQYVNRLTASASQAASFWQVLSGLQRLRQLSVQGSEAQVCLLDCAAHMQQLNSLQVHLNQAHAYPPVVLACLALLPALNQLHLHNLVFVSAREPGTPDTTTAQVGATQGLGLATHTATSVDSITPGMSVMHKPIWDLLCCAAGLQQDAAAQFLLDTLDDLLCDEAALLHPCTSLGLGVRCFPGLTHLSVSTTSSAVIHAILLLCLNTTGNEAGAPAHPAPAAPAMVLAQPAAVAVAMQSAIVQVQPSSSVAAEDTAAATRSAATSPQPPAHYASSSDDAEPAQAAAPLHSINIAFPSSEDAAWLHMLPSLANLTTLNLQGVQRLCPQVLAAWQQGGLTERLTALSLQLSGTRLSGTTLASLMSSCTRLKAVRLSKLVSFGPDELQVLLKSCPQLRLLQVASMWATSYGPSWTGDAVASLAEDGIPQAAYPHIVHFPEWCVDDPPACWQWWEHEHPAIVSQPPASLC